jgi:hypothetical protein
MTGMSPISHLSGAGGINDAVDFTSGVRVYLEDQAQTYYIGALVSPQFPSYDPGLTVEINNHRQIASRHGHAILLTPFGKMIIPGDVEVNRDDYCAWLVAPIDLNGDAVVDPADEQWLIERLLVFGGMEDVDLAIEQRKDTDPAQRTFLFATPVDGKIDVSATKPAIIEISTQRRAFEDGRQAR